MWRKWLAFYYRMSDYEPVRWYWPLIRIYGGPKGSGSRTCYMTRVVLTPRYKWMVERFGQLYLHIFHREDIDRDPHDHPFDFCTLPLNQSYFEEVFDAVSKCFRQQHVPWLRWSFRPAQHIHRVTEAGRGWPLVTLVWRGPTKRKWGFWCHTEDQVPRDTTRVWVPWQSYCFDGTNANVERGDEMCPAGGA